MILASEVQPTLIRTVLHIQRFWLDKKRDDTNDQYILFCKVKSST